MMIWNRARCAWVRWTGTKAAWFALPAASAIVVSACLPVIGARMPLGPAIAHQTAHRAPTVYPVTPSPHVAIAPPLDYVGTPIAYLPPFPTSAPSETVGAIVPAQPVPASVPVPEPGSAALLATAVAAMAVLRMRFYRR